MADWQPIETFDLLPEKKRPRYAAFFFPAEKMGRSTLGEMVEMKRVYGYRTCTHWMPLPEAPTQGEA